MELSHNAYVGGLFEMDHDRRGPHHTVVLHKTSVVAGGSTRSRLLFLVLPLVRSRGSHLGLGPSNNNSPLLCRTMLFYRLQLMPDGIYSVVQYTYIAVCSNLKAKGKCGVAVVSAHDRSYICRLCNLRA